MKHVAVGCMIVAIAVAAYVLFEVATGEPSIKAVCRDGSISKSKTNRGTCSKHGGVAKWTREE